MLTLTRQGLLLSLSATVIPSQGSSDVPVAVVNDINTYVGYTLEPRVGYYLNGIYKSTVCTYDTSAKTFSVPAEAFKQIGIIDITLALIDNANANHIETCQTVHATVNKAPLGTVVLPDQTTWQDYVNSYMNQLFDSNYKPQFDQIQQDLENLVTEAQQQQQTAEQQQTQIDNAISVMGEYQIVSNDPVQIQFKQGDGTFGPTVDLGDGLASKSMVNAGYYQSIGSQYSGSASDYGIEVEEIVGAYSQGLNPSPDNPQEMQAVEISNLYSVGKNLLDVSEVPTSQSSGATVTNNGDGSLTIGGSGNLTGVFSRYTDLPFKVPAGKYYLNVFSEKVFYPYFEVQLRESSSIIKRLSAYQNTVTSTVLSEEEASRINNIRIYLYGSPNNPIIPGTIKPMLTYSETEPETYEPYKGTDTVTLSEPLILRALPNGVADTWKDGTLTHNVSSVTYDGSEDESWGQYGSQGETYFGYFISQDKMQVGTRQKFLCDKFKVENQNVNDKVWFGVNNNLIYFPYVGNDLNITTVDDWKSYLQSNPITVWYQLATPTTEQLAIPTLQSFYPFTNAWCDSIVQPQQIAWNVLTGRSAILDGNGDIIQNGYMTPQDNLLINSDFRSGIINQKGQTNYVVDTSNYKYTIDMWRTKGMTVTVNASSVTIKNSSGSSKVFQQVFTKPSDDYMAVVNVLSVTGNTYIDINNVKSSKLIQGLNKFEYTGEIGFFAINVDNGATIQIEFIKLEKGSFFTGMPVWNKATELIKCYRHMFVLGGAWGNQFSARSDNNYVVITIQTPVELRKTPTIKDLGSSGQVQFTKLDSATLQSANLSEISGVSRDGNFVQLQIPIGSYTQFGLGQAIFTTKICFDAYDY